VYLTITYEQDLGTRDAAPKSQADGESMREILGTQLIRRLDLKQSKPAAVPLARSTIRALRASN
jgi:hypothetical protein